MIENSDIAIQDELVGGEYILGSIDDELGDECHSDVDIGLVDEEGDGLHRLQGDFNIDAVVYAIDGGELEQSKLGGGGQVDQVLAGTGVAVAAVEGQRGQVLLFIHYLNMSTNLQSLIMLAVKISHILTYTINITDAVAPNWRCGRIFWAPCSCIAGSAPR